MPKIKPSHTHQPAVMHRNGGVSAKVLNICVLCGSYLVPSQDGEQWIAISDEAAENIRARHKE